jgi:hypothetical protein
MNSLWTIFQELNSDPWYSRLYAKLGARDLEWAKAFCERHQNLSQESFEFTLNRAFLYPNQKPKQYLYLWELLMVTNQRGRED